MLDLLVRDGHGVGPRGVSIETQVKCLAYLGDLEGITGIIGG